MPLELNYHHLFYFWTCAKAGRITSAAKELHLSQSALSLQIKGLERDLGRVLFNRTRAGLELTASGRTVFEHCEKIFAHGAALSAALRGGPGASPTMIRLGVSSALGREAAMTFMERLGGIEHSLVTVYVGPREDIRERLARRRLDIGVTGVDLSAQLGAGFRGRRIGTLPINFLAAPALARSLAGFPRKGQEVPMLFRTPDYSPRQEVERFLRERGVIPLTVAESEDSDILQTLARQGRGVVALHRTAAQSDLDSGALVRIGPAKTGLQHEIWVVALAQESVDPVVRKAIILANQPSGPRDDRPLHG
ncbi:MAG: LysR family transcriptional regulator [Elusimicrobia bacterium]|nr:LysR family transcriptional regulator [Elusimicrobiota bacterium]